MSQLDTNEILNPTTDKVLPLQFINQTKLGTRSMIANTKFTPASDTMMDPKVSQMDPHKFALKEKLWGHINWNVSNILGATIYNQEITPMLVENAVPNKTDFYYVNSDIKFSFKPNNNAFFQGMYRIYYDPAPAANYYAMFNNFVGLAKAFEFAGVNISSATANVEEIFIPKLYPFNYYNNHNVDTDQQSYQRNYSLGRLTAVVIVPLTTTSGATSMPTMINISFPGYSYGGTILL